MTLNGLATGYDIYNSNASYGKTTYSNETKNSSQKAQNIDTSAITDTVTISEEAKRLNMLSEEKKLPLEANALPKWFDEYIPPSSVLGENVDHDYWNFIGSLTSDSTLSSDEKAEIKNYLKNDETHQKDLTNDKFASEHKNDIKNYITSLNTYFKEALKESGINSKKDYYENVILNDKTSQEVRQSMADKVQNDSTMQKLMLTLGVKG